MATDSAAIRERIEALVAACRGVFQREDLQGAVFLYGSSLERDFRSGSDVDLAVLDDSRHPLSWSEQARLMDILERALGKGVDLRMLRETRPSHQAHVLEQGQLVWSKDPDLVEQYSRDIQGAIQSEREQAAEEWPRVLGRLAGR